jgi:hypothetical protein
MKPQRPTRTDIELLNLLRRRNWERNQITNLRAATFSALCWAAPIWVVILWLATR